MDLDEARAQIQARLSDHPDGSWSEAVELVLRQADGLERVQPVVDAARALCKAWDENRMTSGRALQAAVRALDGEA